MCVCVGGGGGYFFQIFWLGGFLHLSLFFILIVTVGLLLEV